MAEQKEKSIEEYRRDYESLAKKSGGFDLETKKLLLQQEVERKAWLINRKTTRDTLLKQKLAASIALDAAIKRKADEDAAKEEKKAARPVLPVKAEITQ